jgi:hypothetical protein
MDFAAFFLFLEGEELRPICAHRVSFSARAEKSPSPGGNEFALLVETALLDEPLRMYAPRAIGASHACVTMGARSRTFIENASDFAQRD